MKRDAKTKYYQQYFETYKWKSSKVWKGIKSIVKLNTTSKKYISLIDNKGFNVTDPSKIANLFNNYLLVRQLIRPFLILKLILETS